MPNKTILCLASYEKGQEFLRECKRQGCIVYLLTTKDLEHADWPRESIDVFRIVGDNAQIIGPRVQRDQSFYCLRRHDG